MELSVSLVCATEFVRIMLKAI